MPSTTRFKISTKGFNDIIDVTSLIKKEVDRSNIKEGICLVFVAHSTCAIATIEYEEGVIGDFKKALERIVPKNEDYEHSKKMGDGNGYAHVRAALMNPCLTVLIENGKLVLGQWQQVVLIDFDNRPREREVIIKIMKNQ